MLRPSVKRVTSYSAPHCGHLIAMLQPYRCFEMIPKLLQVIRRVNNLEIELEPFVCLDQCSQLFEREEDAIHHDPTIGNVASQSVVSKGQSPLPLEEMADREQLGN